MNEMSVFGTIRLMAKLQIETGMRVDELVKLEWGDIDLAESKIRSPITGQWWALSLKGWTVAMAALNGAGSPLASLVFPSPSTGHALEGTTVTVAFQDLGLNFRRTNRAARARRGRA